MKIEHTRRRVPKVVPWCNAPGLVWCRVGVATARSCIENDVGSCSNTHPRVVTIKAHAGPRDQTKHPNQRWKRYSCHAQLASRVHCTFSWSRAQATTRSVWSGIPTPPDSLDTKYTTIKIDWTSLDMPTFEISLSPSPTWGWKHHGKHRHHIPPSVGPNNHCLQAIPSPSRATMSEQDL